MKRLFLFIFSFLLPSVARAASSDIIPGPDAHPITQYWFRPGTSTDTANNVLKIIWNNIFSVVYLVLGGLAVLLLIYAGIMYITAAGNAEKTRKARTMIFQILLGVAVLAATYTIIAIILGIVQHFTG